MVVPVLVAFGSGKPFSWRKELLKEIEVLVLHFIAFVPYEPDVIGEIKARRCVYGGHRS